MGIEAASPASLGVVPIAEMTGDWQGVEVQLPLISAGHLSVSVRTPHRKGIPLH